ncbi:MAG: hypothetical protein ACYC42_08870 [Lysobacter sp.]
MAAIIQDKPLEHTLPAQLMAKPALSWDEFCFLLDLPESTAELVAREEPAPKFFLIGRRRYIRTEDAVEWLTQRAAAMPYFPRRNKRAP